ncbi:MAG: zf-HC2 domain-containing protein [Nocardioidaceae bacterium]
MTERYECERVGELLAEVAAGIARGPDRARVAWHVAGCSRCGADLDQLLRIADVLRDAVAHDQRDTSDE